MSEVYEATPARCPACSADWSRPGSVRPGWDNGFLTGGFGGRTWECSACGEITLPEHVELKPSPYPPHR